MEDLFATVVHCVLPYVIAHFGHTVRNTLCFAHGPSRYRQTVARRTPLDLLYFCAFPLVLDIPGIIAVFYSWTLAVWTSVADRGRLVNMGKGGYPPVVVPLRVPVGAVHPAAHPLSATVTTRYPLADRCNW